MKPRKHYFVGSGETCSSCGKIFDTDVHCLAHERPETDAEFILRLQNVGARLALEAQAHAQEARGANATIAEIYRLCTGKTGEPGNWNGAEPVRKLIEDRDRLYKVLVELLDMGDFKNGITSRAQDAIRLSELRRDCEPR